jgi:hypothetical protein
LLKYIWTFLYWYISFTDKPFFFCCYFFFLFFFATLFHVHFSARQHNSASFFLVLMENHLNSLFSLLFFLLYCTFFLCRSTPSHFLAFFSSFYSIYNYFCVSTHMIEMREINYIIFLSTYPMADLLSSDHSLQQSLIVDETMWIDHLLYIDD